MELNLDDKYYQKYIKYKNRYMMLKQLKNNIELEGGDQTWWRDYYFYPSREEEKPKPKPVTETFIVFNNEFETYDDLQMLTKLVFKSVDNAVIKKSENKDDPEEQNIQEYDDKNRLMTLTEFYEKFTYGYIIEKTGTEYKYKLFDNGEKEYEYADVDNYLKNLKKCYTLPIYDIKASNANDIAIYNLITAEIKNYNRDNDAFFDDNILTKIQKNIITSGPMQNLLEYSYQIMKRFNDITLDSSNNTNFLSMISEEVKKKEKLLNMLIKIDRNQFEKGNISYIESEANQTSNYLRIQNIINTHRTAVKDKTDKKNAAIVP